MKTPRKRYELSDSKRLYKKISLKDYQNERSASRLKSFKRFDCNSMLKQSRSREASKKLSILIKMDAQFMENSNKNSICLISDLCRSSLQKDNSANSITSGYSNRKRSRSESRSWTRNTKSRTNQLTGKESDDSEEELIKTIEIEYVPEKEVKQNITKIKGINDLIRSGHVPPIMRNFKHKFDRITYEEYETEKCYTITRRRVVEGGAVVEEINRNIIITKVKITEESSKKLIKFDPGRQRSAISETSVSESGNN